MPKKQIGTTPNRNFGRVSSRDWRKICQAAKRSGMTRTAWMLAALLGEAERPYHTAPVMMAGGRVT